MEPPREADIVVGELQSFAISPSYGGPYVGIIATREQYIRQIPGRLVGETTDANGIALFVSRWPRANNTSAARKRPLTSAPIRRLLALMATVYMSVFGKEGLRELAEQNLAKAHYLASKLPLTFDAPFFNEFVVIPGLSRRDEINEALLKQGIVGGVALGRFYPELSNSMLLCATEMNQASGHGHAGRGVPQTVTQAV